jgi:hypothetical protein
MPDYKLVALAALDLSFRQVRNSLKTSELTDAVNGFIGNMDRVVSMCVIPVQLVNLSEPLWTRWKDAEKEVHCNDSLRSNYDNFVKRRPEIAAVLKPFEPWYLPALDDHKEDPHNLKLWEHGLYLIDVMTEKTGGYLGNALEATLSGMVLGAWTAFETLAGDLWVASVNAQPEYLAGLTGAGNRIEKIVREKPKQSHKNMEVEEGNKVTSDGIDDTCEPLSQRQVTLGMMCKVTRGKYDLADKMGTLLAEATRVQFTTLEAIREAYSLAFSEKVRRAKTSQIDAALASKGFDTLSAVRNLIVHKAGVADEEYKGKDWCLPTSLQLREKEKLQLDGEKCRDLVAPVAQACVGLIKSVDSWLTLTRHRSSS